MRRFIGAIVGLIYVCAGVRMRQLRKCRKPGMVLAICGHDPQPRVLETLLRFLIRHGFAFVGPDEILAMRDGLMPMRGNIVWLSFDDGWKNFISDILPILERYEAKATIFVPPHEIECGFLWCDAAKSIGLPRHKIVDLYRKPLSERDGILNGVEIPRSLMSAEELAKIAKHPLITLENHTWSHLSCYHRPVSEVVDEAHRAQTDLMALSGRTPKFLCYPFGHYGNGCDEALLNIGLIGVHSDNGIGSIHEIGKYRNMFRDNMSDLETIGRALDAWPKQRIPDAQPQ